ncbi:MAG: Ig-like domain-containing protein [Gemmatimonadetes bacterium]|nr:Ig-like domain-containing protein [Gemmatimonadota bacterium]
MSAVSIRRQATQFAAALGTLVTFACSSGDSPSAPGSTTPPPAAPVAATLEVQTNGDSILLGTTRAFAARVLDQSGNVVSLPVTWRSLTPTLLEIDANGVVTAIAPGSASVLATSGAASDTGFVVVRAQETPLVINPDLIQIVEGDELQLQAQIAKSLGAGQEASDVEWMSTDREVATIDSVGRLVGLAEGEVTLVARYGACTAVANAVVVPTTVASIALSPSSATLNVGIRETIKATVKDAAGRILTRTITWTSSAPAIASVASNGQVTANKVGYAYITAATGGKSSSATITVRSSPAQTVAVTLPASSIAVGGTQVAKVIALDAGGAPVVGGRVSWQSNNPSVATVDTHGADRRPHGRQGAHLRDRRRHRRVRGPDRDRPGGHEHRHRARLCLGPAERHREADRDGQGPARRRPQDPAFHYVEQRPARPRLGECGRRRHGPRGRNGHRQGHRGVARRLRPNQGHAGPGRLGHRDAGARHRGRRRHARPRGQGV